MAAPPRFRSSPGSAAPRCSSRARTSSRKVPSRLSARAAIIGLLIAAGYYLGGVVGLGLSFPPGGVAAVWLPHGVLLAAMLLIPPRRWWWFALLLPVHLHLVRTFQGPVPLAIAGLQLGGNLAQAALGAAALQRFVGRPARLDNLTRMIAFISLAAFLAPALVSAALAWQHTAGAGGGGFWIAWQRQAFAQACGAVVVTPVILHLARGGLLAALREARRGMAELVLLTVGLVVLLLALFGVESRPPHHLGLPFALLPLLLWSAVRFGAGGLGLSPADRHHLGPAAHPGRARTVRRGLARRRRPGAAGISAGHLHPHGAADRAGAAARRRSSGPCARARPATGRWSRTRPSSSAASCPTGPTPSSTGPTAATSSARPTSCSARTSGSSFPPSNMRRSALPGLDHARAAGGARRARGAWRREARCAGSSGPIAAFFDAGGPHRRVPGRRSRHHRAQARRGRAPPAGGPEAGGRGAARGRPPQGRVPGDAGPRAAQPAGPHRHGGGAAARARRRPTRPSPGPAT